MPYQFFFVPLVKTGKWNIHGLLGFSYWIILVNDELYSPFQVVHSPVSFIIRSRTNFRHLKTKNHTVLPRLGSVGNGDHYVGNWDHPIPITYMGKIRRKNPDKKIIGYNNNIAVELNTKILRLSHFTSTEINICYFMTYLLIYQLEKLDENGANPSYTCHTPTHRANWVNYRSVAHGNDVLLSCSYVGIGGSR